MLMRMIFFCVKCTEEKSSDSVERSSNSVLISILMKFIEIPQFEDICKIPHEFSLFLGENYTSGPRVANHKPFARPPKLS